MEKNRTISRKEGCAASTELPAGMPSSGRLLKRAEAARLLGVSVSTLRRREGADLTPIVDADGVHMFDESEVRSVMVTVRQRKSVHALGASSGDVAADVFTLLDAGEHPVDIVKQLRVAPDAVVALYEQWVVMRGGFTVSAEQAVELGRLAGSRMTATNASAAIAQVDDRIDELTRMRSGSAKCCVCGHTTASMCEACIPATIGPIGSYDVCVERRSAADGGIEIRVCAGVYWNGAGHRGGNVGQLCSEWYVEDDIGNTEICDLVRGIERKAGRHRASPKQNKSRLSPR
jgi:hypothetical protein